MLTRRKFLTSVAAGSLIAGGCATKRRWEGPSTAGSQLPTGNAPLPLSFPHFPSRLHAFVWRNWGLVPSKRMARVVGARQSEILRMGHAMGLPDAPRVSDEQQRRSYITVIKRNWHLLPYGQLLELLDWTATRLEYTLREDDFLFLKLGGHKPNCEPLRWMPSGELARFRDRERAIATSARELIDSRQAEEPLFQFVADLASRPASVETRSEAPQPLRFCYSYFALYGDPLLEPELDPYPEGYLARLAALGVNGVWLQAVLYRLAPFPWQPELSEHHEKRLRNLRKLVERAKKHGIGVYLYLNEPRSMPADFFARWPELKGVVEGDHAALCISTLEVREYLTDAVAAICRGVPGLGGFFTITASENLTNCWSHNNAKGCPRCSLRSASEVIAGVNEAIADGIRKSTSNRLRTAALTPSLSHQMGEGGRRPGEGAPPRLIVWDWGWQDSWAEGIINRLPPGSSLMSVSEWDLPIERGGVKSRVGEYSISSVGPGPRATRHWEFARRRGLKVLAKIQANNTWELSAVPYIPVLENVARHVAGLREHKVDGIMLSWTLGGYTSPNLELVSRLLDSGSLSTDGALATVANERFGSALGKHVVQAWKQWSRAFSQFPFHAAAVYSAPLQVGPANLLWDKPTGYRASMVGFPYDDIESWRSIYPAQTFAELLEGIARDFADGIASLRKNAGALALNEQTIAFLQELNIAEAAAIHFQSVANQTRFVLARQAIAAAKNADEARPQLATLDRLLQAEIGLATRLYQLQRADSRIGFEASNHYYYVPLDLVEKILNCRHLLERWLPQLKVPGR